MDVVISARVPDEAIKILRENKISITEVVRTSIIAAAENQKLKKSQIAIAKLASVLRKIPRDQFIASIREDRDETH
ncbi:hypothetical protein HY990_02975 [Candidatus Micrarchaeota archaeon]|nr:hypothetical protein [Candidatus Micrarchaeota archaeon]